MPKSNSWMPVVNSNPNMVCGPKSVYGSFSHFSDLEGGGRCGGGLCVEDERPLIVGGSCMTFAAVLVGLGVLLVVSRNQGH